MAVTLEAAHQENQALTHKAGANFSVGFRFLPAPRRRAVYAAYAFCRLADDAVDEGDPAEAPARLAVWERELAAVYEGTPTSPAGVALADALRTYPIPRSAFAGLIEGCRQDLVKSRYETFEELLGYCELVAATIGTISLAIFGGLGNPEAEARGHDLAMALQLTNVIRDVGEDAATRDRIYLPQEDLRKFGVTDADILARRTSPAYEALLKFEAERALAYFVAAEPVKDLVDPECRFAVTMMGGIYAEVARRVNARPAKTLVARTRLRLPEKLFAIAVRRVRPRFVL